VPRSLPLGGEGQIEAVRRVLRMGPPTCRVVALTLTCGEASELVSRLVPGSPRFGRHR
jgi:hypothetical protein